MKKTIITGVWIFLLSACGYGQNIYTVDASDIKSDIKSGYLKMGHPGPPGKEIIVNNYFLTIGGKPVIPVMGEVHFSRVPKQQWEDVILKMKAGGINIIATYVFWIHIEEIEGQFDWSGNNDFRAFIKLCAKHQMLVYPRIGPWCHGEVRNGGTPDWILSKTYLKDRTNDPVYQHYVERYYQQVALQMRGLLYKDGGPVIGIQLENEYTRGKAGEAHILWLKETAVKYGIDVPLYTVTGWQNASVPASEVIPLWGAYPDAPWDPHIERNADCVNFHFSPFRDDEKIGNGLAKRDTYIDPTLYPYFTCEMGVGIENTSHRRLAIGSLDGKALVTAKLGSGSNLVGYYMFAGGSNPHGMLSTMEENREETGYWNSNPVVSYDFQAAIRESGQLNASYHEIKQLHYFLNEFGDRLAMMTPVNGQKKDDLEYALRVKDSAAFLFCINYCRNTATGEKNNVQFSIQLKNEHLLFPSQPVTIPDSSVFIWPVNFAMNDVLLKYATAQPLCKTGDSEHTNWIFVQDLKASPEFCFRSASVAKIESTTGKVEAKNGQYIVSGLRPSADCVISVTGKNGKLQKILILSRDEAKQAWVLYYKNQKRLFLSNAGMYVNDGKLHFFSTDSLIRFKVFGGTGKGFQMEDKLIEGRQEGLFSAYSYSVPARRISIGYQPVQPLDGAQWLKSNSIEKPEKNKVLFHRFFIKEFNLSNPSAVKSASLWLSAESDCRVQVNKIFVNQSIDTNKLSILDLTGYVRKGDNTLVVDFPFSEGTKVFAAKLLVEYFNGDRVSFTTDPSWLTTDQYSYPVFGGRPNVFKEPETGTAHRALPAISARTAEFTVNIPADGLEGLSNLYLMLDYTGDKAQLRFRERLVADDFNNGLSWNIGLNRIPNVLEGEPLSLELYPLAAGAKVYFDNGQAKAQAGKAVLKNIRLIPEYAVDLSEKE